MYKRKSTVDLTGNGVNHPNDFGHRVYASALLDQFLGPAPGQVSRPVCSPKQPACGMIRLCRRAPRDTQRTGHRLRTSPLAWHESPRSSARSSNPQLGRSSPTIQGEHDHGKEWIDSRKGSAGFGHADRSRTGGRRRDLGRTAQLLADVFAFYLKTKNFHWHMSGQHFRDYHLLLDEHADQIFAITDDVAERARKIGGVTLHSISDISHYQRLKDNNEEFVAPRAMLKELCDDNRHLTQSAPTHEVCDRHNDVATASMIEVWIDEAERRTWFLSEIARDL